MIFISKIDKPEVGSLLTLVPDESLKKLRSIEKLRQAAKILLIVMDKDMIFESYSVVKKQFFKLYAKLKESVESTHFEEFKQIQATFHQLKHEQNPVSCIEKR